MAESRPKILIVEDEWLIAQFLEEVLEGLGYHVLGPVPSVREALTIVVSEMPDAAILDISLGQENSLAVADELMRKKIPFVFSSGYMRVDLPEPYSDCAILSKPISESELGKSLRSLVHRPEPQSSEHLG
ncbi:MAG TPA: response regulator [Rhizomicrobium sp.]|jgi:CheY-like chemotaxis protein|nr:response regulator [Rhizomicrobium sp.]